MLDWEDDLLLPNCGLFLDSRRPRPWCFVSHAHSDHIGEHEQALCTPATAALAERRIALGRLTELPYSQELEFDCDTRVTLHPAGHILGSAMLHVRRAEGTFLYTGDFKLRSCLTVECAAPVRADYLLMETTYGLPVFRFPPRELVIEQLLTIVEEAFKAGRQPFVMGYSLGTGQEIVKILTDAGHAVTCHGAVWHNNQVYERLRVALGRYRKYVFEDFHGAGAMDLRERGVLVAPPQVARSGFVTRFENPCRIILTGWGLLKNAIYRYRVDHALPLSDHADFDELLELVERVGPRKVFTHHGYREFVDTLRARGIDATYAYNDPQLTLFPE